MKNTIYILCMAMFVLVACNDNSSSDAHNEGASSEIETPKVVEGISFAGTWTRKFSMGPGKEQQVFYTVNSDGINYRMEGAVPMEYTIEMDSFVAKDNRWIGKKGATPYVIFAKNINKDSISLFKQKVESFEKALTMPIPSDSTRSQFTSWNVYQKVVE